jgi:hypothetical protein
MSTPETIQQYQALRAAILRMEAEDRALHTKAGFALSLSELALMESIDKAMRATKPEGML